MGRTVVRTSDNERRCQHSFAVMSISIDALTAATPTTIALTSMEVARVAIRCVVCEQIGGRVDSNANGDDRRVRASAERRNIAWYRTCARDE